MFQSSSISKSKSKAAVKAPLTAKPVTSSSNQQKGEQKNNTVQAGVKSKKLATLSSKRSLEADDAVGSKPNAERQRGIHLCDFEPKSSADLALSRQKLDELKAWFNRQFLTPPDPQRRVFPSPFLLLNGPSGSGKTASIKVLCKEYNVKLIELPATSIFKDEDLISKGVVELSIEKTPAGRRLNDAEIDYHRPVYAESQQSRFNHFLNYLNYCRCSIFDEDMIESHKLLLIEDIPQIFHMNPKLLHDELSALYNKFKSNTVPVVFIISDIVNGPSVEYKVLPKNIQAKLNFQVITFNGVTAACLRKMIGKANAALGDKLSKADIEEIVNASSNDIRNAFNYLSFKHSAAMSSRDCSLFNAGPAKKARVSKKKSSTVQVNSSSSPTDEVGKVLQSGREEQLTLAHAIGKILYAKRSTSVDPNVLSFMDAKSHVDRRLLRNPLMEERPEQIAERANLSCDTIANWVYENYHDFVNEHDFAQAIDCLEVLSLTDSQFSDFESRNAIEPLRTSYLIRGQMFSLNRDNSCYQVADKDATKSKVTRTFRPLRGPQMRQLNRETNENLSKLVALKDSSFYESSIVESDKNLVLDILPSISPMVQLQEKLRKLNLTDFAVELGRFAHSNQRGYQRPNFNAPSLEENDGSEISQQYNRSSLALPNSTATSGHNSIFEESDSDELQIDPDSDEED